MAEKTHSQDRRDFLKSAIATGALYSAGGLPSLIEAADAAGYATPAGPIIVNITLLGGPDMRHLLPPAYTSSTSSFGYRFWKARARSFGIASNPAAWQKRWNDRYYARNSANTRFGILKSAPWLRDMWDDGNVAIVNNVIGSTSRDHEHSIMVMDQGNRKTGPNDLIRSGWGGRLAQQLDANVVSVSRSPRPFCYGAHPSGDITRIDTSKLVGADDTRSFSLYKAKTSGEQAQWDELGMLARTLRSYYGGLRDDIDPDSIFAEFVQMEAKVRKFGRQIDQRLRTVKEPARFRTLQHWDKSPMRHPGFGLQARNLHDALACSDILNMRVASMEMGAWDSHEGQAEMIEPNFKDLFGSNMAFDTLWKNLPGKIKKRVVFCFQGEFGRQLMANGENGTDHGRANSVLLIGKNVRGGIYGDMFPQSEIARINSPSADIQGRTTIDHVYGALCDWAQPGAGDIVFPNRVNSRLESGVSLNGLFT